MNFKSLIASFCFLFFIQNLAFAQLNLPKASPEASVSQTVGLTEISIAYSSPAIKGRSVWGELVPYNQVWRTGANKATTITFSDKIEIAGKKIDAGTYALFTIPQKDEWTIIINEENEQWGAGRYDSTKDVLRFTAKATEIPFTFERLTFTIAALDDESGEISIWWDKLKVSFTIKTDPVSQVVYEIENTLSQANSLWYTYAQAAEYYLDHRQNLEKAMEWINQSISLKSDYYNHWIKARLLVAQNNTGGMSSHTPQAIELAKKAITLGEEKNTSAFKRIRPSIDQFIEYYSNEVIQTDKPKK